MEPDNYIELISALQGTDNDKRAEAEKAQMQTIKTLPFEYVSGLFNLIEAGSLPQDTVVYVCFLIKHFVATLTADHLVNKKNCAAKKLNRAQFDQIKTRLIAFLASPLPLAGKTSLVKAVAALAQLLVKISMAWPEIPAIIREMIASDDNDTAELGATLMVDLCQGRRRFVTQIAPDILRIIAEAPDNRSLEFNAQMCEAVSSMEYTVSVKSPTFKTIRALVAKVWTYLHGAYAQGDEEVCLKIMGQISNMMLYRSKPVRNELTLGWPMLAEFALEEHAPPSLRRTAMNMYLVLCRMFEPQYASKNPPNVTENIFSLILRWCADIEDDPEWATKDDGIPYVDPDSDRFVAVGEQSADSFSTYLGGKVVLPLLEQTIPNMITNPDWKVRHTAAIAVSLMAEGIKDDVNADIIAKIIGWVSFLVADPEPRVRWAVAHSLGQCCTDFAPIIQTHCHAQLMSTFHQLLQDQVQRVIAHAAAGLINVFSESCTELIPYADGTLKLLGALMSVDNMTVQKNVVTCLAAIASISTSYFTAYYKTFMEPLLSCLEGFLSKTLTEPPSKSSFVGRLVEAIALIGRSVGPTMFKDDGLHFLQMLVQYNVFEDDSSSFRTILINALNRVVVTLKDYITPEHVVPIVTMVLKVINGFDNIIAMLENDEEEDEEENSDYEVFALPNGATFKFNVGAVEQISESFLLIQSLLEKCMDQCMSQFNAIAACCKEKMTEEFRDVQSAAGSCLTSLFKAVQQCHCPQEQKDEFFAEAESVFLPLLIRDITDPSSQASVKDSYCEALGWFFWCTAPKTQEAISSQLVDTVLKGVADSREELLRLLKNEEDDIDEDVIDDECDEYINLIRTVASDCIGEGFKVYPTTFLSLYESKWSGLVNGWINGDADIPKEYEDLQTDLRTTAIMVIDDIIAFSQEERAQQYIIPVLDLMYHTITTEREDSAVLQASFYGFKSLFKKWPALGAKFCDQYPEAVHNYVKMITDSTRMKEQIGAFENAISSLGVALDVYTDHYVSNGSFQSMLAFFLLHAKTINDDEEEIETILEILNKRLRADDANFKGPGDCNMAAITRAMIYLVADQINRYFMKNNVVNDTIIIFKSIYAQDPAWWNALVADIGNPIITADLQNLMSEPQPGDLHPQSPQ